MLKFNRILVYTHKFDKWQYIVIKDYDTTKYSILEGIQADEENILNYINNNQNEMAYYYFNDCYYQIISTPKDLLQHIKYTPTDTRKHDMNKGFYEYNFSITDVDTIPIKLVEFAFKNYFDDNYNCEVDLSTVDCTLNDENISKFLYVANELLGLNIFYKVYSNEPLKNIVSSKDCVTISVKDIKNVISNDGVYLTYLKIFEYNLNSPIKIDVVDNTQNSKALNWILSSSKENIENYHDYINLFLPNNGIKIDINNIWNFIDNYSINNGYALKMIINLKNITLDNMISVILNTSQIGNALYGKYLSTIDRISPNELKNFLNIKTNQERLEKVYNKLRYLELKKNISFERFKNSLNVLSLSSNDVNTVLNLIKSMGLSKEIYIDIVSSLLKSQYKRILSQKDILTEENLKLLENIGVIIQYEYPEDFDMKKKLKLNTKKYYKNLFDTLMDINVISVKVKSSVIKNFKFSLNNEIFKELNKFSIRLFWIYNPNFDFRHLSKYEKILILTTPELLLKYIDFCDEIQNYMLIQDIFIENGKILNIGLLQLTYLKYNIYQLLDDNKVLNDFLNSLELEIPLKICKKFLNELKLSFKEIFNEHKFLI